MQCKYQNHLHKSPVTISSMQLTQLSLSHFRNYETKTIDFKTPTTISPTTILVGPNAVGKTSIIEAIHLLASGDSFRATKIEQMIEFDQELGDSVSWRSSSGVWRSKCRVPLMGWERTSPSVTRKKRSGEVERISKGPLRNRA